MKIIGLTGSLACGKTTVAGMFAELGAEVLDADQITHQLMVPETKIWNRIVRAFGEDVLAEDRAIKRDKLADIVFKDAGALKELEKIIHPAVIAEIKQRLAKIKEEEKASFVIIDAPLLIEAGLDKIVDKLVVIKLDQTRQVERAALSGRLAREEAMRRIQHLVPLAEKIEMADYVIDNSGSIEETRQKVQKIWREMNHES